MTDQSLEAYIGLGADINKADNTDEMLEVKEGVVSQKMKPLDLDMEDEEIIKLTSAWKKSWEDSGKKAEWEKAGEENEKYWLGDQYDIPKAGKQRAMVDNLIFEATETFLPRATRRNPDPMVEVHSIDRSEETNPGQDAFVKKLKERLVDVADETKVRLKLKTAARHWAIYLLGVIKYGWDLDKDIPTSRAIRPKRIILDPDAIIDEEGYHGDRIGEIRELTAEQILAMEDLTSEGKKKIEEMTKDKKATKINFVEWWTQQYFCWTLGSTVLYKKKNPHWNYQTKRQSTTVDSYGVETPSIEDVEGNNHFSVPKMPYSFLTVYTIGDRPMDNTSLIGQNLSNQDLINKRNRQIDKNVDKQNSGMVVSLARAGLTKPQAAEVNKALRSGKAVAIPDGSPREAIDTYNPGNIPSDVFTQLFDMRSRLRDIFGISGSTPAGVKEESTVRGKIQIAGLDTDRIGGGITEYLELLADEIYNWYTQLLYVYSRAFQFAPGKKPPKLNISVKEGSLLPKDSISIANQALELAGMNRISTKDLYERLEYPNPGEMAANVWLEQNAPQLLYKDNPLVQQAMQQQQMMAEQEMQQEKAEAQINVKEEAAKQTVQAKANIAEEAGEQAVGKQITGKNTEPTNPKLSNIPI